MLLCVLVFSVITTCFGDLQNYYMHYRCDGGIRMIKDDVYMARLKYSQEDSTGSVNCTMYLRGHFDKLALRFTEFNFPDCYTHLSIRIGDDYPSGRPVPGLEDIMCGPTSPTLGTIYTTDWTEIHMRVEGSSHRDVHFTMLFNAFEDNRRCYKFEQYCKNGRCIDDSIRCNGYNPCGDESDCDKSATGKILASGLGSGAGFLSILFLIKIVEWKMKRTQAASDQHVNGRPSNSNGAGGATAPELAELTTAPELAELTTAPELAELTTHDTNLDALGFNSGPPAYSMIDYVSVPSGATGYSPEPSASAGKITNDEDKNSNDINDEKPALHVSLADGNDSVGQVEYVPSAEYVPPPPPYDVVVQCQNVYDVSDTMV